MQTYRQELPASAANPFACAAFTGCRLILLTQRQTLLGLAHLQVLAAKAFGLLKQPLLKVHILALTHCHAGGPHPSVASVW